MRAPIPTAAITQKLTNTRPVQEPLDGAYRLEVGAHHPALVEALEPAVASVSLTARETAGGVAVSVRAVAFVLPPAVPTLGSLARPRGGAPAPVKPAVIHEKGA